MLPFNLTHMKSLTLTLGVALVALLTLNSCGISEATEEAEKKADEFHQLIKERKYTEIVDMVSDDALKLTQKEDWELLFRQMEEFGKFKKAEAKSSFDTNIENGTTTVSLKYTLYFEKGTLDEEIVFVKTTGEFKILGYTVQEK